jgi:iron-sulfur cluster assembly protein
MAVGEQDVVETRTATRFLPRIAYIDLVPRHSVKDPDMTQPASTRPRIAVLSLTEAATERVRAIMATKGPEVVGLKIGIKKGGCAGMEYTMEWATSIAKFDEVVVKDGAKVIIDPKAVLYLLGTEMDYKVDKLSAQFVFNNPNQKSSCGCGESVNLVPAARDQLEPV